MKKYIELPDFLPTPSSYTLRWTCFGILQTAGAPRLRGGSPGGLGRGGWSTPSGRRCAARSRGAPPAPGHRSTW
eukprot:11158461-Lingulodinium_polyedra.AAC.1